MFCWGNATHHELCIDVSQNTDLIIKPTFSKWSESNHVQTVTAGEFHALYLTTNGHLYSCGNNEVGQLGRQSNSTEGSAPGLVETFKGCTISAISCGVQHSMALDEWGQPFSWGSDILGQLGSNLGAHAQDKPKIIKSLATRNVIQIACGSYHSLALTNNGDLYSWGANTYGQCGLGTMSNKEITPQQISSLQGIPIAMIACGSNHTFALSKSGAVYGWGKNSHGQLGLQDRDNRCYPSHLKSLRNSKVCHIACGEDFTVFLTLEGGVFTCGTGEYGQTGHGATKNELVPRQVMELMGSTVTQVACGRRHLLCRVGERILACGYGARGQLGCPHMSMALLPTPVNFTPNDDSPFSPALFQGPMKVYAGGDHSFLVVNGDKSMCTDFRMPENNKQILTLNMPKLAACEMFKDDDVVNQAQEFDIHTHAFSQKRNYFVVRSEERVSEEYSEHNSCSSQKQDNYFMLQEQTVLMGMPGDGHLQEHQYAISVASSSKPKDMDEVTSIAYQQLLVQPTTETSTAVTSVPGIERSSIPQELIDTGDAEDRLSKTAQPTSSKGGLRLFAVPIAGTVSRRNSPVCRALHGLNKLGSSIPQQPMADTGDAEGKLSKAAQPSSSKDAHLDVPMETMETTAALVLFLDELFDSVNGSLRTQQWKMRCAVKENSPHRELMAYLETVFGSPSCVNASFLLPDNKHYGCNKKVHGVDLKKAEEAFTLISRIENSSIKELIFSHLTENVIKNIKISPPDAEALRLFMILPLYHEMRNPRRHAELQGPFAEAFNKLSIYPQRIVNLWWESEHTDYFEMLVDIFKSVIVYELMQPSVRANKKIYFSHSLIQILNTLSSLNKINFSNPKKPKIPAECFYIEDLSNYVDIATDYINWLADQESSQPHMCNYAFLFDVQCKSLLLKIDQQLQMQMAVTRAATQIFTRIFMDPGYEFQRDQFLNLTVSRNHIVRDTMLQISNHDSSQLKKPLKVEFVGEEAEDAGGVKKEFFLLLLKEIFDPVYGMFKQSEETNMIWFSNNPFEDDVMYYLIGAIYGLAIYNSIIIYVPFPLVLYKKVLGESVILDDLSDLYPTLTNSLKSLLEYPDEDVEDVFTLCFAVNTVVFDQVQVHPLKENGENVPVTHENKAEYVDLYVDFLLNKSVENQFKAFNQGFQKVCGGRIIKLFRSHELMSVVIGNEEYDWDQFQANCEYRDGYTQNDQQIKWFWEVFHELPLDDKKKFLLFLTGSDRVPIQGMRDIKIRIQPVGDDRYFPVAHTCFNLLDLPRYKTKERLKYHLIQAIQQTQGFSLV